MSYQIEDQLVLRMLYTIYIIQASTLCSLRDLDVYTDGQIDVAISTQFQDMYDQEYIYVMGSTIMGSYFCLLYTHLQNYCTLISHF